MIDKIANNKFITEELNLNPIADIKEKLDYYRLLLGKTHDLSAEELQSLKQDVSTFFNLKPAHIVVSC